jgi:hypothetical protein
LLQEKHLVLPRKLPLQHNKMTKLLGTIIGCMMFVYTPDPREPMLPEVDDHSLESAPEDARTVGYLRAEAYAVRDRFTRYSLQILAVTGAILVAIARFQGEMPLIGLMAIFPILLLFHVLIMGVHKYGTSNRFDLLPNLPSLIRRVCSSFAPDWGVLRTRLV